MSLVKYETDDFWTKQAEISAAMYGGPQVSEFDYSAILRGMIESSEGSIQNSVMFFMNTIYKANSHPKKIIKELFPAAKQISTSKYSDGEYEWCIKNQNDDVTGLRQVEWSRKNGYEHGNCIFSLVKQMKPGCTDKEAFSFVGKILFGSDCLKKKTKQYHGGSNYVFLPDSASYDGKESQVAETILKVIDQIAGERQQYTFKTDEGNSSFQLLKWRYNNQNIELYLTLRKDKQTGSIDLELLAPPEDQVYNKHLLKKYRNHEVYIHDSITNAEHSDIPGVVSLWIKDLSALDSIETLLKGRKISCLFNPEDPDSVRFTHEMLQKFQELKMHLDLCECKRWSPLRVIRRRKDHETSTNIAKNALSPLFKLKKRSVSDEEFYDATKKNHGLDLKPEVEEEDMPCSMSPEEIEEIDDQPDFMVAPFFEKEEVILMTAKQKVGKSLLAMTISLMVSSKGSIAQRLSATESYKTFYLDAEMPKKKFKQRFKKLIGDFPNKKKIYQNFRYHCTRAGKINKKLDLTKGVDQKLVEKMIGDAKFVVFDNLVKLLPHNAINSPELWGKVYEWFQSLAMEGRTILLVHHENKNGVHIGTGQMTNDVDLALPLKKPKDCPAQKTIIEFNFEDARNIHGSQRDPFSIEFYEEDGCIKHRVINLDGNPTESLLTDEEAQRHPVQVAMIEAARKADQNTTLPLEDRFIQKKDIDALLLDRSSPTNIADHFTTLCEEKILSKTGYGKGTKYHLYPGPDLPKDTE